MKRVVYHDQDEDGWMSAAVLIKKFPDIELYEVPKSGEDIEIKNGYDEVYVVDHSLWGENNLKEVQKHNKRLIWIDHHKSAIDSFAKDYEGIRDTTKAACVLTWEYLHPNTKVPLAVFHVGDKDIWKFESDKTELFSNYLRTLKESEIIDSYVNLLDKTDLSKEYAIGKEIEHFKKNILEQMYTTGIKRDFDGYPAMVFDGDALRSELMHLALTRNKDINISVVRRSAYIKEGEEFFKYSLRSRSKSNIFVHNICKKHGGGGHPHAGAFISKERF